MDDPPADLVDDDEATVQVSAAAFRAGLVHRTLTPAERAAVQARARFYTMPWLRLANDPDDELPF